MLMSSSSTDLPTPQILSYGLASTNVDFPVESRYSFSFLFCPNLCRLPLYTTSIHFSSHTSASKLLTSRPNFLIAEGSDVARIFALITSSPKILAFSAIIYCSAQLYVTPSTINIDGYH